MRLRARLRVLSQVRTPLWFEDRQDTAVATFKSRPAE